MCRSAAPNSGSKLAKMKKNIEAKPLRFRSVSRGGVVDKCKNAFFIFVTVREVWHCLILEGKIACRREALFFFQTAHTLCKSENHFSRFRDAVVERRKKIDCFRSQRCHSCFFLLLASERYVAQRIFCAPPSDPCVSGEIIAFNLNCLLSGTHARFTICCCSFARFEGMK